MEKKKNIFNSIVQKIDQSTDIIFKECLAGYGNDRSDSLSEEEFSQLLEDAFTFNSSSYTVPEDICRKIFSLLDEDKDGKLGREDFHRCCYYWLKQIVRPVSAFVLVDVQNDFIDGTLALRSCPAGQCGSSILPVINSLLDSVKFDVVVYTKDWHPDNHISFVDNLHLRQLAQDSQVSASEAKVLDAVVFEGPPRTEQVLWPRHCVQGTWGSELHPQLKVVENSYTVVKGTRPEIDSYSAFWDNNKLSQTDLVQILSRNRVTDVYLCGLATDVCVSYTGLHSLEHGFRTVLIEDATKGVDQNNIEKMKQQLVDKGAVIVDSSKVKEMVEGKDRHPQLGLNTAKNVALARDLIKKGIVA